MTYEPPVSTVVRHMSSSRQAARFAYLVDGEVCRGTLEDYARVWKAAQYEDIDLSREVTARNGARYEVGIAYGRPDEAHGIDYTLSIPGAEAVVKINDVRFV